jgi:hypothetical protein
VEGLGGEVRVHGFDVERCGCELNVMFKLEYSTWLIMGCLQSISSSPNIQTTRVRDYLCHKFCDVLRIEGNMTSCHKL